MSAKIKNNAILGNKERYKTLLSMQSYLINARHVDNSLMTATTNYTTVVGVVAQDTNSDLLIKNIAVILNFDLQYSVRLLTSLNTIQNEEFLW